MQNAVNKSEAEQKWNNAKNGAERAVNEVKNDIRGMDPSDLKAVATEIGTKVRDVSTNFYNDSVGFVKRYPVSSALGLAAVGFFLGSLSARMRK